MKQFTLIVLLLVAHITSVFGQNEVSYKEKQQYKNWVRLAPKLEDSFFPNARSYTHSRKCIALPA